MADAVEPVGEDMDQKAANELWRGQTHDLLPVTTLDAVVCPTEGHEVLVGADPQVCRTLVMPTFAPRRFGSAAMVVIVSADARNNRP